MVEMADEDVTMSTHTFLLHESRVWYGETFHLRLYVHSPATRLITGL